MSRRTSTKRRKTISKVPDKIQRTKIEFFGHASDDLEVESTWEITHNNDKQFAVGVLALQTKIEVKFLNYLDSLRRDKGFINQLVMFCAKETTNQWNSDVAFHYDESQQLYTPDIFLNSIEQYKISWLTDDPDDDDKLYYFSAKDNNDKFFRIVNRFKSITLSSIIDEWDNPEFLEKTLHKFLQTIPKHLGYDATKSEFYSTTFDTKILPMLKQPDITGRDIGGLIFDKYLGGGGRKSH